MDTLSGEDRVIINEDNKRILRIGVVYRQALFVSPFPTRTIVVNFENRIRKIMDNEACK